VTSARIRSQRNSQTANTLRREAHSLPDYQSGTLFSRAPCRAPRAAHRASTGIRNALGRRVYSARARNTARESRALPNHASLHFQPLFPVSLFLKDRIRGELHFARAIASKKNGVILRRSDARRAQVAGIAQPKNPVECRNDVRSCLMIFRGLTGSFDSVPPRLRPRSTALRMTSSFDAIAPPSS
jgi:hypothetical protein